MTIKEINELRKNGQLTEALAAAEAEWEKAQNVYTAGALFWCLNDLSKTAEANVPELYVRMKELQEQHGPDDEYMTKALKALERKLLPHFSEVKDAAEVVKKDSSKAIALCKNIKQIYEQGELLEQLYPDYGWIIYHALKNTNVNETHARKLLLFDYLKLDLETPSVLHSLILSEAVKIEKSNPLQFNFKEFVKLWGLGNLRDEDWQQFKTDDGKVFSSLVEKLITVYVRELKTDHVEPANDFVEVLDKALGMFGNNQNLPYFKAITLIAQSKKEEATNYYRQLIIKNPNKFYLWQQTAEIVEDIETRIALLCRAVNTGEDETFIGGARLALAALLIDKGLCANAHHELDIYRKTYEKNQWHLKTEFIDLARRIPQGTIPTSNNKELYNEYATLADQFIYSQLPSTYVVKTGGKMVDDRMHPGRKYLEWTLVTQSKRLFLKKPLKFGLDKKAPDGTIFEAKLLKDKIVWIKPVESEPTLDWLKQATGTVQRRTNKDGKPYAIIDKIYVGERLLKNIADGQTITVIATKRDDKWNAIAIQ